MEDIGTSPESVALQATIEAAPEDVAPQLVLADLLLAADDPRGELIVLDRRERDGDLVDPDALDRLLELAAIYGFPRAEPEPAPVPFTYQYGTTHDAHHDGSIYRVFYTRRVVFCDVDNERRGEWSVKLAVADRWTAEEAALILRAFGDAVREGTPVGRLRLPFERHPLAQYDGAALRCYELPRQYTSRRGLAANRYGLAARDYRRWLALYGSCERIRAARREGEPVTSPADSG